MLLNDSKERWNLLCAFWGHSWRSLHLSSAGLLKENVGEEIAGSLRKRILETEPQGLISSSWSLLPPSLTDLQSYPEEGREIEATPPDSGIEVPRRTSIGRPPPARKYLAGLALKKEEGDGPAKTYSRSGLYLTFLRERRALGSLEEKAGPEKVPEGEEERSLENPVCQ